MCKWCDEIYVSKKTDSAFKRYGYKIEWSEPEKGFFTIEDDCAYEHQIKYCPWCGRKLEAPKEKPKDKAVVLTQEGYDELVRKYEELDNRLGQVCLNLYRFVEKRMWDEKQN